MPLIIDPDDLSQGAVTVVADAVWGTPAGPVVTITSAGSNFPTLGAGDFFEIRTHSQPENNGLYLETGGTPTTGSITATKQTGANPVVAGSESIDFLGNSAAAANEKSVHINTGASEIWLLQQGNLSVDGVTFQALYSFLKEEWKDDDLLIPFPFPMVAITPEQFELGDDWNFAADSDRQLVRTGGWRELDANANIIREYSGIVTLGNFEDNVNDNAHFQQGNDPTDPSGATDFVFAGPVNEAILVFEENYDASVNTLTFADANPDTMSRASGSWITDGYRVGAQVTVRNAANATNNGTYVIDVMTALVLTVSAVGGGDAGLVASTDTQALVAKDFRNALRVFLRVRDADPNGKTFAQQDLADIGVTVLDNKVFRFPLSNATDLKIVETDANIDTLSPFTEVRLRYLDAAFNQEIDSTTKRDFGIVVDVGTYSQSQGVSATSTLFTSASINLGVGEALTDYTGGTLIIHEGSDQGSHTISGTPVDNAGTLEITLTGALTASETNLSFTMQRAAPVTATAEQIYEKIQRQLRVAGDIDETGNVVTGRTADELFEFIGDTLKTGSFFPVNPNLTSGGGVVIQGFDANDTNRLVFIDNSGVERTFPFVAAGTISFNPNLVNDSAPEFWMFFEFTVRTNVVDGALTGASGSAATLNSAGANLPVLADNDYIAITGFANSENNGVWRATAAGSATSVPLLKIDGEAVINETATAIVVDETPVNSPAALIVDDNAGADIVGDITGPSTGFDFDYDGNVQGGRTAGTDAAIVLRAIGLETAQFVESAGTITRAVGQSFSLVAALERNFNNP